MLILISPAKTMKQQCTPKPNSIPLLHEASLQLLNAIQSLSVIDMMNLAKIKEPLAEQTIEYFRSMKFDMLGTSALAAYHGLQFKSMRLSELASHDWNYFQEHLRILSGFYGLLRPLDSIYPYRLEMQAKLTSTNHKNVYAYWGCELANLLYKEVQHHQEPYIISLASKEYEKAIEPYLPESIFFHVVFLIEKNGSLKTESTQAKIARGRMVRYLCDHKVTNIEDIKKFNMDNYSFNPRLSVANRLVFIKKQTVIADENLK